MGQTNSHDTRRCLISKEIEIRSRGAIKGSLEGQVGDQQIQRQIREKMEDILFGRKRMNNEANIETLRSPQKATDILL